MAHAPQEIRTYFVTSVTANRRRLFQVEANARLFVEVLHHYREQGRFALHSFVVMPDHMHLLMTPAADVSLEKAVQFVKGGFSFRLKSKMEVWERGFNEMQILNSEKFRACVAYIEENPVKAGLAESAAAFPFSSAGRHGDCDPMPAHFEK